MRDKSLHRPPGQARNAFTGVSDPNRHTPMKLLLAIGTFAALGACSEEDLSSAKSLPVTQMDDDIQYTQHEFRHEPQQTTGTLVVLVYDIPYFSGCGVFPPLHVINQIFASGGGDGGMSPGASWDPFQINSSTYSLLIEEIRELDPSDLAGRARYTQLKYIEDPSFDAIEDRFEWAEAACDKHRDWYIGQLAKGSE